MSDGEQAKPRRRRGRRRGRRAAGPPQTTAAVESPSGDQAAPRPSPIPEAGPRRPPENRRRRPQERLRTVHETSAGGLVIDGLDRPREEQLAALIGRIDRRGRMLWSLPKGHIEQGETAEQTAMREVADEKDIVVTESPDGFDRRIERLGLYAFDVYMGCREQMWAIRAQEVRNQSVGIMERVAQWRERREEKSENPPQT